SYKTSIRFDTLQLSSPNIYSESVFAKYSSSGNLIWAKTTVGTNTNLISGISCDYVNNLYLTGYFGGNVTLGNSTISSLSPSTDIMLAKVDENGSVLWMKRAGSGYEDAAQAVCSD